MKLALLLLVIIFTNSLHYSKLKHKPIKPFKYPELSKEAIQTLTEGFMKPFMKNFKFSCLRIGEQFSGFVEYYMNYLISVANANAAIEKDKILDLFHKFYYYDLSPKPECVKQSEDFKTLHKDLKNKFEEYKHFLSLHINYDYFDSRSEIFFNKLQSEAGSTYERVFQSGELLAKFLRYIFMMDKNSPVDFYIKRKNIKGY